MPRSFASRSSPPHGSPGAMTALERRGAAAGLKLIQLDGNVGVLANGAGLTMTTMDVIRHFGGKPANFLEIGGEAYTKSEIALDLVLSNPGVKSLVINFCGAFARTDVMADGVVKAWHKLKPKVPVFFSIHGTGEDEAVALVRARTRHRALRFHGRRHPAGGEGGAMIVRKKDRVVVLGITGKQGTFWTEKMLAYGTHVVAGMHPKRAGESHARRADFRHHSRRGQQRRRRRRRHVHPAAHGQGGGRGSGGSRRQAAGGADRAHPGAGRDGDACRRGASRHPHRRAQHRRPGDAGRMLRRHHAGFRAERIQARPRRRRSRAAAASARWSASTSRAPGSANPPSSASAAIPCSAPPRATPCRRSTRTPAPRPRHRRRDRRRDGRGSGRLRAHA